MFVKLKNEAGEVLDCKVGFSWTTLLFGGWVPLCRGDWSNFFIMIIVSMCTCGIAGFVYPFVYNGMYIKKLLSNGYIPANEESRAILAEHELYVAK